MILDCVLERGMQATPLNLLLIRDDVATSLSKVRVDSLELEDDERGGRHARLKIEQGEVGSRDLEYNPVV